MNSSLGILTHKQVCVPVRDTASTRWGAVYRRADTQPSHR
jgi:hypothetical protein